jgi:hypothetical protein
MCSRRISSGAQGSVMMTVEERREKARLRSERWRRAHGIMPRRPVQKPWLAEGISRSTWYRRRAKARSKSSDASSGRALARSAGSQHQRGRCRRRRSRRCGGLQGECCVPLRAGPTASQKTSLLFAFSRRQRRASLASSWKKAPVQLATKSPQNSNCWERPEIELDLDTLTFNGLG